MNILLSRILWMLILVGILVILLVGQYVWGEATDGSKRYKVGKIIIIIGIVCLVSWFIGLLIIGGMGYKLQ